MLDYLILILIGIAIASVVSMVGLGGGIFFLPLLILVFHVEPQYAVGTSIFTMILTNFSATLGFWKRKKVDWKLALVYDVFDIPGIILGAWITTQITGRILATICGIALLILGISVVHKSREKQGQNKSIEPSQESIQVGNQKPIVIDYSQTWQGKKLKWVIISSFLSGLITGLVGIGGGTVDTTSMILLGVPAPMAAGSTQLAMLFTNMVGGATHAYYGNVLWTYAIPMGIGALIGAQIGSHYATKIRPEILRIILGTIAIFTGMRLIFLF
jgi:hypothetical protein